MVLFILRSFGLPPYPVLGVVVAFCVISAVVGSFILLGRQTLRRAERGMLFVLDDAGISRKREGYPELSILFSEMDYVGEEMGYLVIRASKSQKKIAIPESVRDFEVIRAELASHYPLPILTPKAALATRAAFLFAASIVGWTALLVSRRPSLAILGATLGLSTLATGSHHLWALLYRTRRRLLMWTLSLAWLSAILVIYFRVKR
jgi:hypothetical protein